jgi:uncharacterized protein involved in response to NO
MLFYDMKLRTRKSVRMRSTNIHTTIASQDEPAHQEPFLRVVPILASALLMGAGVGFVLASILTLTLALHVSLGPWWIATAQAHGHVQLYGWAGLFVVGVALHFLPLLRGTPLVMPRLVPWILAALVAGLLLRVLSQPLFLVTGSRVWAILLIVSGVLECAALVAVVSLLGMTVRRGPRLATRPAFLGVLPFLVGAFCALGITSCINLVSVVQASMSMGLVPTTTDNLNVTLGLFGFLIPMALAMSAQSLPMYAGLEAFPRRILWPLAGVYFSGLVLTSVGMLAGSQQSAWPGVLNGLGMLLMGIVLLIFISVFMRMMRTRGSLPEKVVRLAPSPEVAIQNYQKRISVERNTYGPFVALVASAYIWALLGSVLLIVDGLPMLFGQTPFFAIDAIRHSLAAGFITLLICGISPRMIPGFSGGKIASPALVGATLWLGNTAALLRVGSLLLATVLATISFAGSSLYSILFGLSGPVGLALAICLAVNLWPALWPQVIDPQSANM